jgi:carbonic anhydrase/acetyltransferase-like protein (isoleucine patch superfamily)
MTESNYPEMSHQDWLDHQANIQRMGAVICDRQTRLAKIAEIKAENKKRIQVQQKLTVHSTSCMMGLAQTIEQVNQFAVLASNTRKAVGA